LNRLSFRAFVSCAERLHEQAVEAASQKGAMPHLIGSILTSWISLESFVNNMMQDYAALPEDTFSVHETGFLEERQVQFNRSGKAAGTFTVSKNPEFKRIEDKVLFLVARFGGGMLDKGGQLWQKFERVKKKRNSLTHYRRDSDIELTTQDSQEAIELAKELIEFLSRKVWNKTVRW
jgi:hypothetical protein